ncbi:hypothetical protein M9Y10_002906 [Tritrichomonas musculus]|uniref:Uncharacterized protein n=1 Tax=Tritrichomonas musculus TaxID=1915356 RepID=A0ABR2LB31_9EUKA
MTSMSGLFKLSFDDSQFQRVFQNFEDKLNRHEEMILELQRLLQQKPNRSELEKAKDNLRQEIEDKLNQFQSELTEQVENKIHELEKKVRDQLGNVSELKQFSNRLAINEELANQNRSQVSELRGYLQTVIESYGAINNSVPVLNEHLHKVLLGSTNLVTNNFKSIFDTLNQYKADFNQCFDDLKNLREELSKEQERNKNAISIDFTKIDPQPEFKTNWRTKPILPEMFKFTNITEVIEYFYNLESKLQGYLSAMHERVIDNTVGLENATDKATLDKLLEKLRRAILEMDSDLTELRNGIGKNLTRKEVLKMIGEALHPDENDGTSIGTVKCIACGRDTPIVNGAIPENEAIKKLGIPPNSLTLLNLNGSNTQMYSSLSTLKAGINEAPKSVRSFHACKVKKKPVSRP